jgi:hypothetical protein
MLASLYQKHLENQLKDSELLFFNLMINVLQDIKEVSLEKLASALPLPILFESRRKKVQRFLSLPILQIQKIWFPVIKGWVAQNLPTSETIYLVIDRTKWSQKNLIMISLVYDQRAIPIYFEFLPKLGNSDFSEQSRVLSQVISLFKQLKIIVLGDREFCSVSLAALAQGAESTVLPKVEKK